MTSTQTPAIELSELAKSFPSGSGDVHAVRGIDLTIERGQIVALLGPNGAGKTTTLDLVLGLVSPTSGRAQVLGKDPRAAVSSGQVSALLQTGGLLRDLSVRETVRMIASTHGAGARVDAVLERSGLTDLQHRKVAKCSGGEQQRLRFALALLPNPDILILDEPTAGMDVSARRAFWDVMREETSAGRTVVFATHYLEEAESFADRIVLMSEGRIIADGSTDEVRNLASGRVVAVTVDAERVEESVKGLRGHPGVVDVSVHGERITIQAKDADAVALHALSTLGARDLEVTKPSLEAAFVSLTSTPMPTDATATNQEEIA